MAKRIIVPTGAADDVFKLVRLDSEQLCDLVDLFSTTESAAPMRTTFVNRVAEKLHLSVDDARSVVVVCHYLLLRSHESTHGNDNAAKDVVDDVREFVDQHASSDDRDAMLQRIDANREQLESLSTPKPARLRALKVRRLAAGPERSIESVRTLCQLRPLFDGDDDQEEIVGLVPAILLEIEAIDDDGSSRTFCFGMSTTGLDDLQRTVERTKEKLQAIRAKYGSELLTEE